MGSSDGDICEEEVEEVREKLQQLGVHLLEREEVRAMQSAKCVFAGAGWYGSCVKGVDPATQQAVVIKTFNGRNLQSLLKEVRNLQHFLHVPGVQQLVGVSVENCQAVTCYAGRTVEQYFKQPVPFAHAVTVFLQLARAVQAMPARGYTHNDLKNENLCVLDTSSGPLATIIDLGIATPLGTWRVFGPKSCYEDQPEEPPELQANTHPTSEASDAYRFAYNVKKTLQLCDGVPRTSLVRAFKRWLEAALRHDPAQRPTMEALVRVLEALQEAMLSVSPSRQSPTDQAGRAKQSREVRVARTRRQCRGTDSTSWTSLRQDRRVRVLRKRR